MKKIGNVTSITLVRQYSTNLSLLDVVIDTFDSYKMFYDYNDALKFIGQDVEFITTQDIIDGFEYTVIHSFTVKNIVNCVELKETEDEEYETSLIPKLSKTSKVVSFDSTSLKVGDVSKAQIVFIHDCVNGKSLVSKWKDFKCLDCNSKSFNLRLFSNDDNIDEFVSNIVGRYAMVDIKNTHYGLQVLDGGTMEVYQQEVVLPHEVLAARLLLNRYLTKDKELSDYVNKYDMIEKLSKIIKYELGYNLVDMAIEMKLINTLCSIDNSNYDRKLLMRAVFVTRSYLVGDKVSLSNYTVNYHRLITSSLKNDSKLLQLLDVNYIPEEPDRNKDAYLNIRKFAFNIIKERRGIVEENSINDNVRVINTEYDGLF